jgi:hypothetical protein
MDEYLKYAQNELDKIRKELPNTKSDLKIAFKEWLEQVKANFNK